MKVSELSGEQLDYFVAKALGDRFARIVGAEEHVRCEARFGEMWPWHRFSPSSAWMHGGPIIDVARIGLDEKGGQKFAWLRGDWEQTFSALGPTALVAAMRAYVASKLGEDVSEETSA